MPYLVFRSLLRVFAIAASTVAGPYTSRRVAPRRLLLPICLGMLAVFAVHAGAQQPAASSSVQPADQGQGTTEAELRQMLAGKFLYLRGGYLANTLRFDDYGVLVGHSPQGSYTLNIIEIDKVSLRKHKVELRGVRYGLHFLGTLPSEDLTSAVDRVRITPPKKYVKITIGRMTVVKPRRKKNKAKAAEGAPLPGRPHDATTTTSPAYAAKILRQAIGNVFAFTLDARMKAAMPAFWKRYYQVADTKSGSQVTDPGVLRQGEVDRKARLLTGIHAPSNEYAQNCGVAGMALYHAVIGTDGKPEAITVARPIGFGLDESAVAAIRKGRFEPAMKNGKPVPVQLDLVVEFRIYAERTSGSAPSGGSRAPSRPFSGRHP